MISRRSFLQTSSVLVGSLFGSAPIGSALSYGRVIGANDRVRLAIAGAGGRGGEHVGFLKEIPNVEIAWLVDPDSKRTEGLAKRVNEHYGNTPKTTADYKKMLDDKDVDFVAVASCNHWHALMGIWACQAGKDVYLEKPACQNLHEGRILVDTAKKTGRLVQHGTQRRSEISSARLAAAVRSNKYGKLVAAKVYCHRPRGPLGFKPPVDPPATLDWEQWIGPAAMVPYHGNLVPYNWHWFWNTGNGEIGNNGVHYFDVCRWAMDVKHPTGAISFGTRFVNDPENKYKDQAETPNIQFVLYDFNGVPLIYESCNLAGPKGEWAPYEKAEFHTENGVLSGDWFTSHDGKKEKIDAEFTAPAKGVGSKNTSVENIANFVDCLRNRESVKLNAPIEEGFYSTAVCHWGNVSQRTAKPAPLEKIRETMGDNPVLAKSIDVVMANVQKVLKDVPLKDIPFVIGDKIVIDPVKERCVDNAVADQFLTRPKRKPFAVPDAV